MATIRSPFCGYNMTAAPADACRTLMTPCTSPSPAAHSQTHIVVPTVAVSLPGADHPSAVNIVFDRTLMQFSSRESRTPSAYGQKYYSTVVSEANWKKTRRVNERANAQALADGIMRPWPSVNYAYLLHNKCNQYIAVSTHFHRRLMQKRLQHRDS